ncbi:MAG: lysophospholipid acyltransferase family protein [Anaerolineales bacterium]
MTQFFQWLLVLLIKAGTTILCRIDKPDLANVPANGPLILATNHISSLEAPVLLAYLQPRRMTTIAKIETWDNKFMGWLFDLWNSIPIRRGEADLEAIHRCLGVLAAGSILFVAPEGTRSRDGILLRGRPGVVLIALHAGVPILPVVHWGGESFSENLRRLKRTDFHIRVGKPFRLNAQGEKVNGQVRQAMVDEIMYQIAGLLPEEYRGLYANGTPPPQKYLQFA